MSTTKLPRDVHGNTSLYKLFCAHYRIFNIYACHWIILSYTTSFISSISLWVNTSFYPLQVCGIFLTRFNEFRIFCPSSFVYPLVKGTNNFWKVRGLIDEFNGSRIHISYGVEKCQMSRWVTCNFVAPLKDIYRATSILLGIRDHWGHRWIVWLARGWGQCFT